LGLIGRVLSFVRTSRNAAQVADVKMDPGGGGVNVTAEHFAPPGDDAFPLGTDYVYAGATPQRGRVAAVGYIDPLNAPKARRGEKRIYSRDSAGAVVADHWLKADGSVVTENENGSVTLGADGSILAQNADGYFELQAGGAFVANGATATTDGDFVTSDGVSLRDHTHIGNFGSPTSKPII